MRHTATKAGFTLLEMLVAMALMSILAGALYAALHGAFSAQRATEARLEPARRLSAALRIIAADLQSALPPTGLLAGPFVGQDGQDERGNPADTVQFFAPVRWPQQWKPPAPFAQVELAVEQDPETAEPVLVRRLTPSVLAPEMPEPTEQVLLRGVACFDLAYFDGVDWLDSWDSTVRGDVLPKAVHVTLAITDKEGRQRALGRTLLLPCAAEPQVEEGGLLP